MTALTHGEQAGHHGRHVHARPARRRRCRPASCRRSTARRRRRSRRSAPTATRSCSAPTRPATRPRSTPALPIKTGPYEGLIALQTPYQLDVTAPDDDRRRSAPGPHDRSGGDSGVPVRHVLGRRPVVLRRPTTSTSAAACTPTATCSCRRATGATLTLSDKVTAVKEVIRQRLSNGVSHRHRRPHRRHRQHRDRRRVRIATLAANGRQPDRRPRQRAERADVAHDVARAPTTARSATAAPARRR